MVLCLPPVKAPVSLGVRQRVPKDKGFLEVLRLVQVVGTVYAIIKLDVSKVLRQAEGL